MNQSKSDELKHDYLCASVQQDEDGTVCTCDRLGDKDIEELFNMVYQWGRVGLVVDFTAPAFVSSLAQIFIDRRKR